MIISSQGVQFYHSTRKKNFFLCVSLYVFLLTFLRALFLLHVVTPWCFFVAIVVYCFFSVFFGCYFLAVFFSVFFRLFFLAVFSTVFLHLAKVPSTNVWHIPAFCGICSSRLQEYDVSTYDHQVDNRPLIELQRHFLDILVFFGCRRRTGGNNAELASHTKRSFVGVPRKVSNGR